jgi:RNA-directed DNA polymerase
MVKSPGGQRESEGVVVPRIGVQPDAPGGKGPHFDRTGRNRAGADIRDVIADINPVLRGWGNYFRTGNAAAKFRQANDYVVRRLFRLMVKKRGRNLHARQARQWNEAWFNGHGLHKLSGTVRYPKAA